MLNPNFKKLTSSAAAPAGQVAGAQPVAGTQPAAGTLPAAQVAQPATGTLPAGQVAQPAGAVPAANAPVAGGVGATTGKLLLHPSTNPN